MKKKNIWLVACFISLSICIGAVANLVVSAADVADAVTSDEVTSESVAETLLEETGSDTAPIESESVSKVPEETNGLDLYAFYMRIWEFANDNRSDLISLCCSVVVALFTLLAKRSADRKSNAISQDLQIVKQDASGTHASQGSVVGAINTMIDGYNEMRGSYEKYEGIEDDRNKLIGAVFIQNTAILEILTTVYVNSKNMPQGVKDLVNLKYAKCLKTLESDELLRGVVEAVRQEIGAVDAAKEKVEAPEATDGSSEETEG